MLLRNAAPIRIDIRKEDYARAETAATWAEDGCGCDEGRGKERGLCAVHRRSGNVWRVRIFSRSSFCAGSSSVGSMNYIFGDCDSLTTAPTAADGMILVIQSTAAGVRLGAPSIVAKRSEDGHRDSMCLFEKKRGQL